MKIIIYTIVLFLSFSAYTQDTVDVIHPNKGFLFSIDGNFGQGFQVGNRPIIGNENVRKGFSNTVSAKFGYTLKGFRGSIGLNSLRLAFIERQPLTDEVGALVCDDCKFVWSDLYIAPSLEIGYSTQHKFPLYGVLNVSGSYGFLLKRIVKLKSDISTDYTDEYFPAKVDRQELSNEPAYDKFIVQVGVGIGLRINNSISIETKATHTQWIGVEFDRKYFISGGQVAFLFTFIK